MTSEFLAWFIAQHGARERGVMADKSDDELNCMIHDGKLAAMVLQSREEWDARQQSALYAWQARDKKEPTA